MTLVINAFFLPSFTNVHFVCWNCKGIKGGKKKDKDTLYAIFLCVRYNCIYIITRRLNKLPPVILKEIKQMMEARILISFKNTLMAAGMKEPLCCKSQEELLQSR